MDKNIFSGQPDPERPLMIQRLRSGHEKKPVWDRLFKQLVENKACCDEVWFSTGIGVPLLEKHRKRSALMAEHAAELRKHGIVPSLQIQSTLGHSDDITASAGAEGKTRQKERAGKARASDRRGHCGGGPDHSRCVQRQRESRAHQSRKYLYGVCRPWIM